MDIQQLHLDCVDKRKTLVSTTICSGGALATAHKKPSFQAFKANHGLQVTRSKTPGLGYKGNSFVTPC
jgi:hypothetical protein